MEQQVSIALEPVRGFMVQLGQFLPKLILAVIVLVAGWLLAKFVRFAIIKGLNAVGFNVLTEKAGIDGFLKQGGVTENAIGILGLLFYWLVVLGALLVAFNALGLTYATDLVAQIFRFVPQVIVAALLLAVGFYFARFLGDVVTTYSRNMGLEDADLVGRLTRYAIVVFVIVIALDQVGIGGDIIRQTFLLVIAGAVLALAIAFGIGGQKWAADQLEKWGKRPPTKKKES